MLGVLFRANWKVCLERTFALKAILTDHKVSLRNGEIVAGMHAAQLRNPLFAAVFLHRSVELALDSHLF